MNSLFARSAATLLVALLCIASPAYAAENPAPPAPTKTTLVTEQGIPIAVLSPDGKKAVVTKIRLRWNPPAADSTAPVPLEFEFVESAAPEQLGLVRAQLWNASLAGARLWQEPWRGGKWEIKHVPATDGTGLGGALTAGLMTTAARELYPQDTVILADVTPDGGLAPVRQLLPRLEAVAKAGYRRVFIPSVQRLDGGELGEGPAINTVQKAQALGLECVPADRLSDILKAILRTLPPLPVAADRITYSPAVFNYLDRFCQEERSILEKARAQRPAPDALAQAPAAVQAAWQEQTELQNAADDAYRAGRLYAAYTLLRSANAHLRGLRWVGNPPPDGDLKTYDEQAAQARQRLRMKRLAASDDGNVALALLAAEEQRQIDLIEDPLEGAQLLARQVYGTESPADATQRAHAREMLARSIEAAQYAAENDSFWKGLREIVATEASRLAPRPILHAATLVPQLVSAQLATAEFLADGIRRRAGGLQPALLENLELLAQLRRLRDVKTAQEYRQSQAAPTPASGTPGGLVGFAPSAAAYAPPEPPPALKAQTTSEWMECLTWANAAATLSRLNVQYLQLGGQWDANARRWQMDRRAMLQMMLETAEGGAREGIALAQRAGVETTALALIFERASYLRGVAQPLQQLEALSEFWRCALLGSLIDQLTWKPPIETPPVKAAITAGAITPAPKPAPEPETPTHATAPAPVENAAEPSTSSAPEPSQDLPPPEPDSSVAEEARESAPAP